MKIILFIVNRLEKEWILVDVFINKQISCHNETFVKKARTSGFSTVLEREEVSVQQEGTKIVTPKLLIWRIFVNISVQGGIVKKIVAC